VDSAHVIPKKDTSAAANAGPPLPPTGTVDEIRTVRLGYGGGFLVTQGDAVGATRSMMRTRETGQRWEIAHAPKLAGFRQGYQNGDDFMRCRMKGNASTALTHSDLMQDLLVGPSAMGATHRHR
jgi:hypothetical protein